VLRAPRFGPHGWRYVSFANESAPLPPHLSRLRVYAIEVAPSSVTHAACGSQGCRSRVPAVLIPALGELAAPDFAVAGSSEGRAWIAVLPALSGHLARGRDGAYILSRTYGIGRATCDVSFGLTRRTVTTRRRSHVAPSGVRPSDRHVHGKCANPE
jgi:hypothetical protein